jgi:Uma2 family endonuclease
MHATRAGALAHHSLVHAERGRSSAELAESATGCQRDDGSICDGFKRPAMSIKRQATVDDLYRVPGNSKAELVNGEIVLMSPTGDLPGYAGFKITASLMDQGRRTRTGRGIPDNVGFIVRLPHRRSFSPDAAFHIGPAFGGKFIDGAPVFAVEVRSSGEYGAVAEGAMAAKRADYFAAGTLVVWDVDVLREECVRVYRAADPKAFSIYHRGEHAEAEPAVPGWTFAVDDLFLPEEPLEISRADDRDK